jgi:hypothetical protein
MKNAAQRPDVTHRETPADGGDEGSRWRQRARVADVHAGICADVHAGRRRMTTVTLEAVCQAATRLADLDRSLWAARTPEGSPAGSGAVRGSWGRSAVSAAYPWAVARDAHGAGTARPRR